MSSLICHVPAMKKVDHLKLKTRCVRGSQIYRLGEKASFEILVSSEEAFVPDLTVTVQLSSDTQTLFCEKKCLIAKENPIRIDWEMATPGFLRCRATIQNGAESILDECAAAFEPENILPVLPEPADFDQFWATALSRLDSISADIKCEEVPEYATEDYTAYRVSFANIANSRIYGMLTMPTSKHGLPPFPTVFEVPSAGPGVREPKEFCFSATPRNYICFNVNVHAWDIASDKEVCDRHHDELNSKSHYFEQGLESPESYYFYRSIIGCHRAMKWLYERDDVDKNHFLYYGGSQGGFMGFNQVALAGDRFTAAMYHIPAMADAGGILIGRHPMTCEVKSMEKHLDTMAYYDSVNFAKRIKCPVMMTVGFIDNCCFPSAIYAAYNSLVCEKYILNGLESGHGGSFDYKKHLSVMWAWMKTRLNRNY